MSADDLPLQEIPLVQTAEIPFSQFIDFARSHQCFGAQVRVKEGCYRVQFRLKKEVAEAATIA